MYKGCLEGRAMGIETEFGAIPNGAGHIIGGYPTIVDSKGTIIASESLLNGGRLYRDFQEHLEYATPECTSARDLALYDAAGILVIRDQVHQILAEGNVKVEDVRVYKDNCDFDISGEHTYGSHENYQVWASAVPTIRRAVLPFLVTRQIFADSGRFSPYLGFRISQRAFHMEAEESIDTAQNRPLVNTREEPHSHMQFARLHLIGGDSNMNEHATYLRVGTTSLVLDMIEEGIINEDTFSLEDPIATVQKIAWDPFGTEVQLEDERVMTPIELQREYQQLAKEHIERLKPTPEKRDIIQRWGEILGMLETGDLESVAPYTDWVRKKIMLDALKHRLERPKPGKEPLAPRVIKLRLAHTDVGYHLVYPMEESYFFRVLQQHGAVSRMFTDEELAYAGNNPPDTRARIRRLLIDEAIEMGKPIKINWGQVHDIDRKLWTFPDPRRGHGDISLEEVRAIAEINDYEIKC